MMIKACNFPKWGFQQNNILGQDSSLGIFTPELNYTLGAQFTTIFNDAAVQEVVSGFTLPEVSETPSRNMLISMRKSTLVINGLAVIYHERCYAQLFSCLKVMLRANE